MPLAQWDPFRELLTLQERMNRLFDQTFSRSRSQTGDLGGGTWSPAVDVYESQENLILKAELPGVDQGDIELRVDSNRISIKGERRVKKGGKQKKFHPLGSALRPLHPSFT